MNTNPAQDTSKADMESWLRSAAEAADAGQPIPDKPGIGALKNQSSQEETPKEDGQGTSAPEVEQESSPAEEKDPAQKPEKSDEPEPIEEPQDPTDKYNLSQREQKTKERYDKHFEKLNKDRREFETARGKWESSVDSILKENQALKERVSVYEKERPDVIKLDPEFFRQKAKESRSQGDYEAEEQWLKKEEDLHKQLADHYERQKRTQAEFSHEVARIKKHIVEEYPEITDTNSELRKTAEAVFASPNENLVRFLRSVPEGEYLAVQLAKLQIDAATAESLAKENNQLKQQLKDKDKKLGLSGSAKPLQKNSSSPSRMTMGEHENFLRGKLAGLDDR